MAGFIQFPQGDPRAKLAQVRRAVYEGCLDAAQDAGRLCAAKTRRNLQDAGRIDTGDLAGSIEYAVKAYPDRIEVAIGFGKPYGRWVEFGRAGSIDSPKGIDLRRAAKAAWPPVQVIKDWVHRHFKSFAPLGRTKSGRARTGVGLDAAEDALTYLIGRKIAKHGIPPTPVLGPAYESVRKLFPAMLRKAVDARVKGIKP